MKVKMFIGSNSDEDLSRFVKGVECYFIKEYEGQIGHNDRIVSIYYE